MYNCEKVSTVNNGDFETRENDRECQNEKKCIMTYDSEKGKMATYWVTSKEFEEFVLLNW